jgi:putative ABC transport system substrate-binding protein
MRRRDFIAGLTSTAVLPLAARSQQPNLPVLGLLNGASFEGPYAGPVAAIRRGLEEAGFVEGRNLALEYRSADGRYERLPELASDLIRSQVAAIVAIGGVTTELAAKADSSTIPILFAGGSDAVEVGLVNRLDRPQATSAAAPASRRLELMLELRRGTALIAYLDNSRLAAAFNANVESVMEAARNRGRDLLVLDAGSEAAVETAFTRMALQRVRGLVVGPDPFLISRQRQIIELAAETGLAAIYATRGAAVLGGLMSYGVLTDDMYRLAGIYAGRILNGEAPADSPVALPTRFELVINRRTADALRIAVPRQLLVRADEIIY